MTAIKTAAAGDEQGGRVPLETDIRDFVRRDAALRRAPEMDNETVANSLTSLLQRVSGSSADEIDRIIGELQALRELLDREGARLQREIAEYASLSQSAMQSTKVIAEGLAQWKSTADHHRARG